MPVAGTAANGQSQCSMVLIRRQYSTTEHETNWSKAYLRSIRICAHKTVLLSFIRIIHVPVACLFSSSVTRVRHGEARVRVRVEQLQQKHRRSGTQTRKHDIKRTDVNNINYVHPNTRFSRSINSRDRYNKACRREITGSQREHRRLSTNAH